MKKLAIYHAPQEHGTPYVMFVNLEDGKPVGEPIYIPEGYYNSGFETKSYLEPIIGEYVTKKHSGNYIPKVGDIESYRQGKYIRLKKIGNIQPWTGKLKGYGYDATLVYEVCRKKAGYRFDASKDFFRQGMEEQGIDMNGWCVYKRRKTEFIDFLRAILPDVINIISINSID